MLTCKNFEPAYPLQAMLVNILRGGRHREMCNVPDKGAQPACLAAAAAAAAIGDNFNDSSCRKAQLLTRAAASF